MTDEAASPGQRTVEPDHCEHCGTYWDYHDRDHLATTCFPIRIRKLEQALAAARVEAVALRELVQHFLDAWANDGSDEPSAIGYEWAVEKARTFLAAVPPQPTPGLTAEAIFEHIKHGDEAHQQWLLTKLRELVQPPTPGGE